MAVEGEKASSGAKPQAGGSTRPKAIKSALKSVKRHRSALKVLCKVLAAFNVLMVVAVAVGGYVLFRLPPSGDQSTQGREQAARELGMTEAALMANTPLNETLGSLRTSSVRDDATSMIASFRADGIVRVDRMLRDETSGALLRHINALLADVRAHSAGERRLGNILAREHRYDVLLGLEAPVVAALTEALDALKAPLSSLVGEDALLVELAAVVSDPRAPRQPVHPDTRFEDGFSTCTVQLALQDVDEAMGPTIFLPGSHTEEAHAAYLTGADEKTRLLRTGPVTRGLLRRGDATLYDSRLLHCGDANDSRERRVLFYFSFRARGAPEPSNAGSLQHGLRGKYSLQDTEHWLWVQPPGVTAQLEAKGWRREALEGLGETVHDHGTHSIAIVDQAESQARAAFGEMHDQLAELHARLSTPELSRLETWGRSRFQGEQQAAWARLRHAFSAPQEPTGANYSYLIGLSPRVDSGDIRQVELLMTPSWPFLRTPAGARLRASAEAVKQRLALGLNAQADARGRPIEWGGYRLHVSHHLMVAWPGAPAQDMHDDCPDVAERGEYTTIAMHLHAPDGSGGTQFQQSGGHSTMTHSTPGALLAFGGYNAPHRGLANVRGRSGDAFSDPTQDARVFAFAVVSATRDPNVQPRLASGTVVGSLWEAERAALSAPAAKPPMPNLTCAEDVAA